MSEKELKLTIIGIAPAKAFNELRELKNLGVYTLGSAQEIQNFDRYFDTSLLDLKNNHASFRIRKKSLGLPVITFKSQETTSQTQSGEHERNEIEGDPFGNSTLTDIWAELASIGESFAQREFPREGVIESVLNGMGFKEILSSTNQRIKRSISNEIGKEVAELVLDNVVFEHKGKSSGNFFEIEIEVFEDKETLLAELRTALYALYPNRLEPSQKSKYERGFDFLQIDVDLRNEYKLRVDGDIDAIIQHIREKGEFAGYPVQEVRRSLTDHYYDTPNRQLRDNSCYLRIRSEEGYDELTFRRYTLSMKSSQIIDQVQIKEPVSIGSLKRVAKYLKEENIVPIKLNVNELNAFQSGLRKIGLHQLLKAKIDRVIFNIVDGQKLLVNIKLDKVDFTDVESGKKDTYSEVEISTDEPNFGTAGIALMIANTFGLSLAYYSKYVVGDHLLRTGEVPKPPDEEELRVIARANVISSDGIEPLNQQSYLKSLDRLIAGVKENLKVNGNHVISDMDSINKLENRIDQTLHNYEKRSSQMIGMALALFIIGIGFFSVSIYLALLGNVPTVLPIAGMSIGILLNIFIYFPFRVITKTRDQEIELSTRASLLRFELEHGLSDKESRDKLIQRAWKGPNP
jgi:inorganic triphosphatase YgiF